MSVQDSSKAKLEHRNYTRQNRGKTAKNWQSQGRQEMGNRGQARPYKSQEGARTQRRIFRPLQNEGTLGCDQNNQKWKEPMTG
jgi:hypothetical protein